MKGSGNTRPWQCPYRGKSSRRAGGRSRKLSCSTTKHRRQSLAERQRKCKGKAVCLSPAPALILPEQPVLVPVQRRPARPLGQDVPRPGKDPQITYEPSKNKKNGADLKDSWKIAGLPTRASGWPLRSAAAPLSTAATPPAGPAPTRTPCRALQVREERRCLSHGVQRKRNRKAVTHPRSPPPGSSWRAGVGARL